MSKSPGKKLKEQQAKIAELEQALGRKQIQIDFYEKMFELAEEQYDLDVKKTFSSKPSTGSESTKI